MYLTNNMIVRNLLIALWIMGGLVSCERIDEGHSPVVSGIKPAPVTNVLVANFSGGAEISYRLPDVGLMYVIAEYETSPGVVREAKSSRYKETLVVDGFPAEGTYEVKLYAVGKDEKRSEPVSVQVSPLEPPYLATFNSLAAAPTFGGLSVGFQNPGEGNLVIEVITPDSTDASQWVVAERQYTNAVSGQFAARGFEPEERTFGIVVRDRWNNISDTAFHRVTPLFEQALPKGNFEEVRLPTDRWEADTWSGHWKGVSQIWDGNYGSYGAPGGAWWSYFSAPGMSPPFHISFYLGGEYQLSRFKMFGIVDLPELAYSNVFCKKFELWGTSEPDFVTGSFDNWVLLGTYENKKPSGLPVNGGVTAEDMAKWASGFEHEVDMSAPKVSYLRVRILETFEPGNQVFITEMDFWGAKSEDN